jgi:RNA polymerase-binding transcription factor DksA
MNGDDDIDVAARLQDMFNQNGVAAARQAAAQQTDPDFDGKHCIECAEVIPQGRLDLGRINCYSCQDGLEKRKRFYR